MYDCVIILGGGLKNNSDIPEWVINRLDKALEYDSKFYLVLSRGTVHKRPPLDSNNFPIDESTKSAEYLIKKGVKPEKILLEGWSLDTIGNAYGALVMHCIPRKLKKLLIITSDFHMPRTKKIFEKIFSLVDEKFELEFKCSFSELGISEKEKLSLKNWENTCKSINNMGDMHNFIFLNHNAYKSVKEKEKNLSKEDMLMYSCNT